MDKWKEKEMKNIKEERLRRGMSQSELAAAAGIKLPTLQRLEQGVNDPRGAAAETICRIARALKIPAEDFVLESEDF